MVLTDAFARIHLWLQLWVSAEDGRQDPGKPIKSHGKLGFEYCVPGVVTAQSDVSSLILLPFSGCQHTLSHHCFLCWRPLDGPCVSMDIFGFSYTEAVIDWVWVWCSWTW